MNRIEKADMPDGQVAVLIPMYGSFYIGLASQAVFAIWMRVVEVTDEQRLWGVFACLFPWWLALFASTCLLRHRLLRYTLQLGTIFGAILALLFLRYELQIAS